MNVIPGKLLKGVTLPPNWERAYDYDGSARYVAAWWETCGDEAVVADGKCSATANRFVFQDLIHLLEQAGHGEARWVLGFSDADATHALLLDLQERTVRVAPMREVLAWLASSAQPEPTPEIGATKTDLGSLLQALDRVMGQIEAEARDRRQGMTLCPVCVGSRWLKTADWRVDGYRPCGRCDGGLVPVEEAKTGGHL